MFHSVNNYNWQDNPFVLTICSTATYSIQVQFFDNPQRYNQGIEFYAKRFAHCIEEGTPDLRLDATPNTIEHSQRVYDLYSQPAAGDLLQNLKLILIVREPIERELSSYNHKVFDYKKAGSLGWTNDTWYRDVVKKSDGSVKSFTEYCEFVKKYMMNGADTYTISHYVEHLRKWTSLFDRKRILVLSYDELKGDPSRVQWRLEQFLGSKFAGSLQGVNIKSQKPQRAKIPESAVKVLQPIFQKRNQEVRIFCSALILPRLPH